MAESDKIADFEQLGDWLKTQDIRISRAIAARASLRSLPALMALSKQVLGDTQGATLLLTGLRATLTSGVASVARKPELEYVESAAVSAAARRAYPAAFADEAARSALSAARSAARSATHSADAAARAADAAYSSALSADSVGVEKHSVAFSDAEVGQTGDQLKIFRTSLWHGSLQADHMLAMWEEFTARNDPKGIWSFWCEWYRGMLTGQPMDWDLQLHFALIDDAVWEAGPEVVAKEIERIQTDWVSQNLPQADKVSFDSNARLFETTPIALPSDALLETTLKQVEFSRSIAAKSNCGFNSNSTAWLYIDFTLESCRSDANAIEQNLEIAFKDLVEGLENSTYQPDAKLSALMSVLERAITDLRANHPEVAKAWETRIKHNLRLVKAEQKQQLAEQSSELAALSHEKLAAEIKLDAKTIVETTGDVQGGAIRRFFGRVAQMRVVVRSSEVVKQIDASSGYKGTRIVQTLQSLLELITGLWTG